MVSLLSIALAATRSPHNVLKVLSQVDARCRVKVVGWPSKRSRRNCSQFELPLSVLGLLLPFPVA